MLDRDADAGQELYQTIGYHQYEALDASIIETDRMPQGRRAEGRRAKRAEKIRRSKGGLPRRAHFQSTASG